MPHISIDSQRWARARRIKSKDILEFNVVNEDPVVAYCKIQGSEAQPYTVIINCEKNYLAHYCADFSGNYNNCKHIAKLLMLLPETLSDRINKHKGKLDKIRSRDLSSYLDEIKQKAILNSPEDEEISLEDRINLLVKNFESTQFRNKIIPTIISMISSEMAELSPPANLERIFSILTLIPNEKKKEFLHMLKAPFQKAFQDNLQQLTARFWVCEITSRLEFIHYLVRASHLLEIPISFQNLKVPNSLHASEAVDCLIIFQYAYGNDLAMLKSQIPEKLYDKLPFGHPEIETRKRLLHRKLQYSKSHLDGLLHWLLQESGRLNGYINEEERLKQVDSFFIYLLKSSNTIARINVYFGYGDGYSRYSTKTVDASPCLSYIFSHIKHSGREYVTYDEYKAHKPLFEYIGGNQSHKSIAQLPNWQESPRIRNMDTVLPTLGIIVQWDVNALLHYPQFLNAYEENKRIIFDDRSPVLPKIQPFDFTLCAPNMVCLSPELYKVFPQIILMPDQVISLLKKGMKIISNVLPFHVLTDYYRGLFVSGGQISYAIKRCVDYSFVFGALNLKQALEQIYWGSSSGLDPEHFGQFRKSLLNSTRRLNDETRGWCRQIIFSEGPELTFFLKLIGSPISDVHLKLVMKAVLENEDIHDFRYEIIWKIFEELIKSHGFTLNLFKEIQDHNYGLYDFTPILLTELFQQHIKKLKTLLNRARHPTTEQLDRNLFAQLYLRQKKIPKSQPLSEEQFADLKSQLDSILQEIIIK